VRTRSLGKTGLTVSELALGTWGLSGDAYGPVPETDQDRVIERARALGITLFETADAYGDGAMERKLGERFASDSDARVVTKLGTDRTATPPRKRFDAAYLAEAFEKSRERLRRETVDLVLLHNPAKTTIEQSDATAFLAGLREKGKIRAWGVSAGSVDVARAALARGAEVLSLTYHALFASDVRTLHDDIQKSGAGLLAHSVLGYGLLCGYWSLHKEFPAGDHRRDRWTYDELRRRVPQLNALRVFLGAEVGTLRGAAVRFVLSNTDVSAALLGPKSTLQLDQLVREAGKEPPYLSEEQLVKFKNRLEDLGIAT
jgi:aryl-alcohol dehydrogenase-like predicted oxidoreductase